MDGKSWTAGWESCRLAAYDDATGAAVPANGTCEGTLTIGRGHTGPDVMPGLIWTQTRADGQYEADYEIAQDNALRAAGHGLSPLGDARWAVLSDMAFELGLHGLEEFVHMLDAIRHGAWSLASSALLDSEYAKQAPRRAKANAQILLTGNWITPHPNDPSIT